MNQKDVKKIINQLFAHKKIRYLITGGSAALIEFIFFILIDMSLNLIVVANVISFSAGLMYSFLLHRVWTFKGRHSVNPKIQFLSYSLLALFNLVTTSGIIYYLHSNLLVASWIAKLICMLLVVTWNFILLNKVIFRQKADDK